MQITIAAMLRAGYDTQSAEAMAKGVCGVDQEAHAQDIDPRHTHKHAMGGRLTLAGRKTGSRWESCTDAYAGTKELLRQFINDGDVKHALHLIQDAWPIGHYGYKPWYGFVLVGHSGLTAAAALAHVLGDAYADPDRVAGATNASEQFLKDYLNHSLGDSSQYLPGSCSQSQLVVCTNRDALFGLSPRFGTHEANRAIWPD